MTNTMISSKEIKALEQIYKDVDIFIEAHNAMSIKEKANCIHYATGVEKVHIMLYMDLVKDFIRDLGTLRGLLDESEEEFLRVVTDNGKTSLDEVERTLMFNSFMGMITE